MRLVLRTVSAVGRWDPGAHSWTARHRPSPNNHSLSVLILSVADASLVRPNQGREASKAGRQARQGDLKKASKAGRQEVSFEGARDSSIVTKRGSQEWLARCRLGYERSCPISSISYSISCPPILSLSMVAVTIRVGPLGSRSPFEIGYFTDGWLHCRLWSGCKWQR